MTNLNLPSLPNEPQRLRTLREYAVLDTPRESEFDETTQLVAELLNCPNAYINLIDHRRQWTKSHFGARLPELPREQSLCAHTILQPDQVMVVPDVARDERFRGHSPLLDGEQARFYAGAPLVAPDGSVLGALCVLDTEPHASDEDAARDEDVRSPLTAHQKRLLQLQATQIVNMLELRKSLTFTQIQLEEQKLVLEQLELTLHSAQMARLRIDPEAQLLYPDQSLKEVFGLSAEVPLALPLLIRERVAAAHQSEVQAQIAQATLGVETSFHFRFLHNELGWRWVQVMLNRYRQQKRSILLGIARDVTEQYEQQRERAQLLDRVEMALEAAEFGLVRVDLGSGKYLSFDEMFAAQHRIEPALPELWTVQEVVRDNIHAADSAEIAQQLEEARESGHPLRLEYRILPKEEETELRWIEAVGRVVEESDGQVLVALTRDITKEKGAADLREQLLREQEQQKKIRSLGLLTAQLGHELRTPAQGLGAQAELMALFLERGKYEKLPPLLERVNHHVAMIHQLLDSMRRLTRKSFLGSDKNQRSPVTFQELVEQAIALEQEDAPREVCWVVDLNAPEAEVCGIQSDLLRAIRNLLQNAVQAVEEHHDPQVWVLLREEEEEQLLFTVRDNGVGMDQETQERVFEPFFTTRETGQASGLGMSFCHSTFESHQGVIELESKPEVGTTVSVRVPVWREEQSSEGYLQSAG
jgi:PAS domain S-box-containing protein